MEPGCAVVLDEARLEWYSVGWIEITDSSYGNQLTYLPVL
jgi:hypothetical protein